ncbi:MAG TPA: o-succinylbenzoate synthase [Acidimicrobiales bacterium]|nr:o-succinylbenzoate synthase [Acidimicrobiales bacterium]
MQIEAVALRRVSMPLVRPFRTSFGTETDRDVVLVRVRTAEGDGWGECVAMGEPGYSSEYVEAAQLVLRKHLVPRLLSHDGVGAFDVSRVLAPVRGHRMAKAALEMAVLDAELRVRGQSLADALGATKSAVECGVSVGIPGSIDELLAQVSGYLVDGYKRIKLKIEPGWDIEPVRAVRDAFPTVPLQVDANQAYTEGDAERLAKLDDCDLLLIEQPLAEDDLIGHAKLSRKIATPICLDESLHSAADTLTAIELGACSIVNIKAGRVGGYLEAVKVHDLCLSIGVPVWCGGMLETGLGRAANLALAALPGFTLPGDTSASDRYFFTDITEPFVMHDGVLDVPTGPGLGVAPDIDILTKFTTAVEEIRRNF